MSEAARTWYHATYSPSFCVNLYSKQQVKLCLSLNQECLFGVFLVVAMSRLTFSSICKKRKLDDAYIKCIKPPAIRFPRMLFIHFSKKRMLDEVMSKIAVS